MTTRGAVRTALRRTTVTALNWGGQNNTEWTDLLSIDRTEVPGSPGDPCYVIAFGHLGAFQNQGYQNVQARITLRWGFQSQLSELPTTQTWIDMDTTRGALPNNAYPWGTVYYVPAGVWQQGTLLISAYMKHYQPTRPINAGFDVDGLTLVVLDAATTNIDHATSSTSRALNYAAPPPATPTNILMKTMLPWSSGTVDWLVFMSHQVRTLSTNGPYEVWVGKHPVDDWDNFDTSIGVQGRIGITGANTPTANYGDGRNKFSMCYWWPVPVSNATTSVRMRGQSLYDQGSRHVIDEAMILIVPASSLDDVYTFTVATDNEYFNYTNIFLEQEPRNINAVDLGDSRRNYIAMIAAQPDPSPATRDVSRVMTSVGIDGRSDRTPRSQPAPLETEFRLNWERLTAYSSQIATDPHAVFGPGLVYTHNGGWFSQTSLATTFRGSQISLLAFSPTADGDATPPTPPALTRIILSVPGELVDGDWQVNPVPVSIGTSVDFKVERDRLETDDGYAITAPRYLKPRRVVRLEWHGLNATQRELLVGDGVTWGYLNHPGYRALQFNDVPFGYGRGNVIAQLALLIDATSIDEKPVGYKSWDISVMGLELKYGI